MADSIKTASKPQKAGKNEPLIFPVSRALGSEIKHAARTHGISEEDAMTRALEHGMAVMEADFPWPDRGSEQRL